MIKKCFAIGLIGLFVAIGAASAQAPDQSTPDGLIKTVVSDVMASVKSDPEIQKGNIPRIVELVDKKIVPTPICVVLQKWQWALIGKRLVQNSRLN